MMTEMQRPRSRLVPYGMIAGAGACFTIFRPPSVQATSDLVQSAFHLTLLIGAVGAIYGAMSARERIEFASLIVVFGPLLAYTGLLVGLFLDQPYPDRFAPLGLAFMFAAGVAFLWLFARVLRREIREDTHRRDNDG